MTYPSGGSGKTPKFRPVDPARECNRLYPVLTFRIDAALTGRRGAEPRTPFVRQRTKDVIASCRGGIMAANGLRIIGDIYLREARQGFFCNLSATAAKDLIAIEIALHYSRHAVIYFEGQACRGIFVVSAGRVKLSATSFDGETMIFKIAGPGEVLGLPESIAGRSYETRAAALESCQLIFIPRANLLNLLNQHSDAAAQVIRELSNGCLSMIESVLENGQTPPASRKLARFLLRWCAANGDSESPAELTLTHEEIGQAIGSARETVTRLLSVFKEKQLIRLCGSSLLITDSAGLKSHALSLTHESRSTPGLRLRPHIPTAR
jgi:CRP/FNR family cyclic AMP-dependent transcriptional regulator